MGAGLGPAAGRPCLLKQLPADWEQALVAALADMRAKLMTLRSTSTVSDRCQTRGKSELPCGRSR